MGNPSPAAHSMIDLGTTTDKRCLVVIDDDAMNLQLMARALHHEFEVIAFNSPSEALVFLAANPAHAILVDVHMPNIDGYELISRLRSHPMIAHTPIIGMSGTNSDEVRTRLTGLGACGFLSKPPAYNTLAADIQVLLQTLNQSILSRDERRRFYIFHQDADREYEVRRALLEPAPVGEIRVVISCTLGRDFFENFLPNPLREGSLIYLEVKPQLIIKFPYLVEMSSVIHDLLGFLDPGKHNYHLFLDEPRNLFSLQNEERTLASAYSLAQGFRTLFQQQTYFSTKPTERQHIRWLHKVASILIEGRLN